MTFTNKKSLLALLISLLMVVSLFTLGVSATEEATSSTAEDILGAPSATDEVTDDVATEANSNAETETSGNEETTEEKEEESTEDYAAEVTETMRKKRNALIINAAIIAVIIIICVVLAVKFRTKLAAFFRSVKSELGKIVWSSKENTRKSFLVVIIVAVAIAIIIGILDLAFTNGIGMLNKLIG